MAIGNEWAVFDLDDHAVTGVVTDSSGNGRDQTLIGQSGRNTTASWSEENCRFGRGMRCAGYGKSNDPKIEIADPAENGWAADHTVSFWTRYDVRDAGSVTQLSYGTNAYKRGPRINWDSKYYSQVRDRLECYLGSTETYLKTGVTPGGGVWFHVCIRRKDGLWDIWLDGEQKIEPSDGGVIDQDQRLVIGHNGFGSSYDAYAQVTMDRVRIYMSALSDEEIIELSQETPGDSEPEVLEVSPAVQWVTPGGSVSMEAIPENGEAGDGPVSGLTYEWHYGDLPGAPTIASDTSQWGDRISGYDSELLEIAGAGSGDAGVYWCKVTNSSDVVILEYLDTTSRSLLYVGTPGSTAGPIDPQVAQSTTTKRLRPYQPMVRRGARTPEEIGREFEKYWGWLNTELIPVLSEIPGFDVQVARRRAPAPSDSLGLASVTASSRATAADVQRVFEMEVAGPANVRVGSLVRLAGSGVIALASRDTLANGPTHVVTAILDGNRYLVTNMGNVKVRVTGGVSAVPTRLQLSATDGVAEAAGTAISDGELAFAVGLAMETVSGDGLILACLQIGLLPWMQWGVA